MPEILTESFCERCGTRYTFESATPRGPRLKGLKVMSRGLRNFVLSDDTSMDEAMAAARNETDRERTAQQLDAFHKTFNFCMSCRQYTCGNCWNEADGRCLSCAPHLGHEILPAPFSNIGAGGAISLTDSEAIGLNDRNGHDAPAPAPAEPMAWPEPDPMAWPTSDLMPDQERSADGPSSFAEAIEAAARLDALSVPAEAPPTDEVAPPVIEAQPEIEASEETPVEAQVEVAPPAILPAPDAAPTDRAAAAAANTTDLLHRFRPGESIDDEIAAYERDQAAAAGAAMAAAAEAAAAQAEAAEAAAAQARAEEAAIAEARAEEAAAAAAPAELEAEPIAGEPRDDLVFQPTWQIVAPEAPTSDGVPAPTTPAPSPSAPPDAVAASAEPQWPAQPEWPRPPSADGLPFLGRPVAATGGIEALWAESAREVASGSPAAAPKAMGGVQPCVSCGLSLSANARFCRRCGTRQG